MPDRLNTPAKGSSDWDVPLNDNFTLLDTIVEVRESRAPDSSQESPDNGAKFLDLSTGDIYIADGSSWGSPVFNIGDIPAFDDGTSVGSFNELDTGTGLTGSISSGRLTIDTTGSGGSGVDVQDSGGTTAAADTLNFATDLTASVTDGTATIDSTASGGSGSMWTQTSWTSTESGNTASAGSSIWVNTSGGNVIVNLPTPASNIQVRVKHQTDGGTGNQCLVSPNGTETIDGNSNDYAVPYNGSYTFECNGSEWETF